MTMKNAEVSQQKPKERHYDLTDECLVARYQTLSPEDKALVIKKAKSLINKANQRPSAGAYRNGK